MKKQLWHKLLAVVFALALFLTACGGEAQPSAATPTQQPAAASEPSAQPAEPDLTAQSEPATPTQDPTIEAEPIPLPEDGAYTTKEDVALYLHLYGHLPQNFITKKEAQALGWTGGGLDAYAPNKSIGGDRFGNYEGLLPQADGRTYQECDIDTMGASSRGAKRIVYSNDGLIFYTEDHYESFTLLYGEETS